MDELTKLSQGFFGGGYFPFDIAIGTNAVYTSKHHKSLKNRKLLEREEDEAERAPTL